MFPWEESNSRSASKDRMDLKGGYQEDGSTQGWGEKYDQSDGDRREKVPITRKEPASLEDV